MIRLVLVGGSVVGSISSDRFPFPVACVAHDKVDQQLVLLVVSPINETVAFDQIVVESPSSL
jgi:hypothetical protein